MVKLGEGEAAGESRKFRPLRRSKSPFGAKGLPFPVLLRISPSARFGGGGWRVGGTGENAED